MGLRLERRHEEFRGLFWLAAGLSFVAALVVGGLILWAFGADPFQAYWVMAKSAFGSKNSLAEIVVKAIPLTLTGLAVALAATMLLWNIGCEGQIVWGGIGAAGAALFVTPLLPPALTLPVVILAGMAGGALWALIPAALKAVWNVNEILTTLLLNYVALFYMEHLFFGPWRDPQGYGFPGTAIIPAAANFPRFWGTRVHLGLVFALVFVGLFYFLLNHSKWGYQIRVIGQGSRAARYAGINLTRNILLVMAASGGLAGLAGAAEVCGIHYRLQAGLTVGYGFDGIIVAWLARLNPLAVPLMAALLGALIVGGEQLQSVMGLPSAISLVLEGVLLLGILATDALTRYRLVWEGKGKS
jgi:general nucleoside transport system permease protein